MYSKSKPVKRPSAVEKSSKIVSLRPSPEALPNDYKKIKKMIKR